MKKLYYLFIITLIAFSNQKVNSQTLGVTPPSANQGQSLTVTFTDPVASFTTGSPCALVTAANVTFSDGVTNFSPSSLNVVNGTTATANITVPGAATAGAYDVTFAGGCPLSCNNCFTVIAPGPDLSIDLQHIGNLSRGKTETYTVNYGNNGTVTVSNVYALIVIPAGLTYQNSSVPYTSLSNDTLRWDLGSLAASASGSFTIDFRVDSAYTVFGKFLSVKGEIYPMIGDVAPANNIDSIKNQVYHPDLYLVPDQGKLTQSLTATFTGNTSGFSQASTCVNPNYIKFKHNSGTYTFTANSSVYSTTLDSAFVTFGIPSAAPLGLYDVEFCLVKCDDCFLVKPNVTPTGQNLAVYLTDISNVRRNRNHAYQVFYQNKGVDTMNAVIQMTYDNKMTYLSSSPVYSSKTSNVLTWNVNNILPGTSGTINVVLNLPGSVAINTMLTHSVHIAPVTGDTDTTDNQDTTIQTVTGSYDPNDKTAYPNDEIDENQEFITYVVRFQNTGNAPAFRVEIRDVISGLLDFASIQTLTASHSYYYEVEPGNKIRWVFEGINLPDSASDPLGSQGFVKYRVPLNGSLSLGDTIYNFADIYFDENPPIRTNTTKNYLADTTSGIGHINGNGRMVIYPNPSSGKVWIGLNNAPEQLQQIEVYSLTGKLLLQQQLTVSGRESKIALDLHSLEAGIYFVSLKGSGQTFTEKLLLLKDE